jgi:group II intron reverse transcriptase/maturase
MQTANQILQAIRKLGEKRIPLTRIYRCLFNENLYLAAYAKIYRNQGALTAGTENDTVDAMSLKRIRDIIEALKSEQFRFKSSRRIHIPKKSGGTRPLGIPNFTDKLVQEVMRMVLDAYYEPRFRDSSHGFRTERGCHSALKHVKMKFVGAVWFIEGDIRGCFDNINHTILLDILARDIEDGRLINLIRMALNAGAMEGWRYEKTYSGVPQGGVLSPLLSNIYLHKLDTYIEDLLIPQHTSGKFRVQNPEYKGLMRKIDRARQLGDTTLERQLVQQRRKIPRGMTNDPNYRRLQYVRYADDFLLSYIGPKSEAESIKEAIGTFLRDKLQLQMSDAKTLITHARSEQARFLGYAVNTQLVNDKLCGSGTTLKKARNVNGKIRLGIPHGLVDELIRKVYRSEGKIAADHNLLAHSDAHILMTYQTRFRGLAEYYKFAADRGSLSKLRNAMQESLVKTLAKKFKTTVSRIFAKYRKPITVNGEIFTSLQVIVPTKHGEQVIYWGAVSLKAEKPGRQPLHDTRYFEPWGDVRSDLVQRLRADTCELCGHEGDCVVHHVRKLADLKTRWAGREKPEWIRRMMALQRKTLIVCRPCHADIHAGRPIPNNRI